MPHLDTRSLDIVDSIEGVYNQRRMHPSVGGKTPADVRFNLQAA